MENREDVLKSMATADFDKLTDAQLRSAQASFLKRVAKKARDVVREVLAGKEEDIIRSLTSPPFIYTTPDIKVSSGMTVRLQSLNNDQVIDAYRQVDQFMSREDANNLRVTNELNLALLSHSLVKVNGMDFGGVDAVENYHELVRSDPEMARKTLAEVRDKRRAALGAMPMPIVQRLVEFYLALQVAVDGAANGDSLGDILGN
jgi:hypothetical protein